MWGKRKTSKRKRIYIVSASLDKTGSAAKNRGKTTRLKRERRKKSKKNIKITGGTERGPSQRGQVQEEAVASQGKQICETYAQRDCKHAKVVTKAEEKKRKVSYVSVSLAQAELDERQA